jgi:hypothetical protein
MALTRVNIAAAAKWHLTCRFVGPGGLEPTTRGFPVGTSHYVPTVTEKTA